MERNIGYNGVWREFQGEGKDIIVELWFTFENELEISKSMKQCRGFLIYGDLENDVERFWKESVLVVRDARVTEDEDT